SESGAQGAGPELGGPARRNRRGSGGRLRSPADHQYGHRALQGGNRPDRRRHHHRTDAVLRRSHRRARRYPPPRKGGRVVSRTAVVAFGGNALVTDAEHDSIPEQYDTVCRTGPHLRQMIEQGWRLVVSHGNGPQVGFILRRSELSQDEVDPVPVDYAVADTQGAIGYMFVKALGNELRRRGLERPVAAVVTQSVVDPADP